MLRTLLYGAGGALLLGPGGGYVAGALAGGSGLVAGATLIVGTVAGGAYGAYKGHQADKRASEEKAPKHVREREGVKKKLAERIEEKFRRDGVVPRLADVPQGVFRQLNHNLKLQIAYLTIGEYGLGGAIKTAIERKIG